MFRDIESLNAAIARSFPGTEQRLALRRQESENALFLRSIRQRTPTKRQLRAMASLERSLAAFCPSQGSRPTLGFGRATLLELVACEQRMRLPSQADNSWKRHRAMPWRHDTEAMS